MEANPALLSTNQAFIASAIERIRAFAGTLPGPDRHTPSRLTAEQVTATQHDLDAYREAMHRALPMTRAETSAAAPDPLPGLFSAHALTLAMAAQLEATDALAQSSGSAASAPPPSGWLGILRHLLGQLANWIWSVIQIMLTPKGWSIEGGISVPGLAQAKLKIDFG